MIRWCDRRTYDKFEGKLLENGDEHKEDSMLYYALAFLLVGLVAAALGLSGVAAISTQVAYVLFIIGIVLVVIHLFRGGTPPVT